MVLDPQADMSADIAELASEPTLQDRAERQMTVLINAGIRRGENDGLCRIRNVSAAGLNIETSLVLTVDDAVTIILQSGRALDCVVRWIKDGRVGLRCATDPAEALQNERTTPLDESAAPAALHFARHLPVQLAVHGFVHHCDLDSISIRHAVLTSVRTNVQPPQVVTISIMALGDFPATVRARQDGVVLARFNAPISFALLDPWLVSEQNSAPKRAAAR